MRLLLFLILSFCIIAIFYGIKPQSKTIERNDQNSIHDLDTVANVKDSITENIVLENDSVVILMKFLPGTDEFTPYPTEIWIKNKMTDISRLIVKSNPDSCFRREIPYLYEKDIYREYPIDSIPTILRCIPVPDKTQIIVDGSTCDFGWEATFKIDWVSGTCYVLPSNNGFVEFEGGTNNIIISSRFNDIDPDLVIWYEEFYTITPTGKIIKKVSTKNQEIENNLLLIHSEARLNITAIKLVKYQALKPKNTDEYYWGNRFDYKYISFDESIIKQLDSLVQSNPKWKKINSHYRYEEVDDVNKDYQSFLKIDINPKTKTGILYKGMFADIRNVPVFKD